MRALPLVVFLGSYAATTAIGAIAPLTPFGAQHFQYFVGTDAIVHMRTLGTAFYWTMLLMPFALVPLGAAIGYRIAATPAFEQYALKDVWQPGAALLLAVGTAYCAYKLQGVGGLLPISAIDPSICVNEKIVRRAELINSLGNPLYFFLGGALPIIAAIFLTRFVRRDDRVALLLYIVCTLVAVWLCLAVFMKAPLLIFLIAGVCTALLAGARWWRAIPSFAAASLGVYAVLTITQLCKAPAIATEVLKTSPIAEEVVKAPSIAVEVPNVPPTAVDGAQAPAVVAENPPPAPRVPSAAPPPEAPTARAQPPAARQSSLKPAPQLLNPRQQHPDAETETKTQRYGVKLVRDLTFRLAVAFPYYVEIFSDPDERCGIWLPRSRGACFAPVKAFAIAYPYYGSIVVGFLPAPINASALAEAGPIYAVVATLLAGLVIGLLTGISAGRSGSASIAVATAACVYAYYVSQASLMGSFFDAYGLVWMLATVATIMLLTKARDLWAHHAPPGRPQLSS